MRLVVDFTRPLVKWIPRRKFRKNLKILNNFVDPFIERVLQMPPSQLSELENKSSSTFLHALAGYTRDRQVLRDQLVSCPTSELPGKQKSDLTGCRNARGERYDSRDDVLSYA